MLAPARTILVRTIHNQYPHFRATDLRSRGKRTLESALHTLGRVSLVSVSPAVSASLPWAAKRHCVIHNGVSFDRVAALAGEAHPRSSTSADTIVMVCMGRLEQQKNFPLLLRSFALCVRRTQHPLLLWILGEGSDRRRLEQDAQQLGIAHLVQFLGHRDNPFPWVASADIYVSTSEYEGLSLALIEAMGLGLPVVTTRSGGVTDSLATGGDLLIVEQHEAEPFADAVMSLVEDETLRRRVAHQGMSTARSCYSLDQMLVAYGNLYRNITAGIA
jgi:glycosyltransferase involved in cell wall biosynthesis